MKVMVVDDEADVELLFKQGFRRELRKRQIEFLFFLSAEAVRDYLQNQANVEIALILSDI